MCEPAWGCIHSSVFMPVPLKKERELHSCSSIWLLYPEGICSPLSPLSRESIKTHGLDFESDRKSNPATPTVKMRHSVPSPPPCQESDFVIFLWGKEGNFLYPVKVPDSSSP